MRWNIVEEKKCLSAAKKGDLDAFETLLSHYEKPILSYILRMVNSRYDAEDLAQETFLKLYQRLGVIDPEKNFRAWLYTIATHIVYDWLRKKRGGREYFVLDQLEDRPETLSPTLTYTEVERLATKKDLERALERIRPAYKTVLLLYYQQGFDYQEIAHILTLPLNTVKTHLARAKVALRTELTRIHGSSRN